MRLCLTLIWRFIPVCTGNIPQLTRYRLGWPVYPCVYREHNTPVSATMGYVGLSLCVQGTSLMSHQSRIELRFIPVCTGNIVGSLVKKIICSVYPCVYREHDSIFNDKNFNTGLSLCVQGTCQARKSYDLTKRFIPVCTGNICSSNER